MVVPIVVINLNETHAALDEPAREQASKRKGAGLLRVIAMGNVVGSNIFKLLFIGGVVSMLHPIPVPAGGLIDLAVLTLLSALVLPIAIQGPRKITRAEGAFLLSLYLSYVVWRVWMAGGS